MQVTHSKNKVIGTFSVCLFTFLTLPLSLAHAQQFTFSSYGEGSGLSNLNVNNLLQDHAGVLWTGTENGVFTADGNLFAKQDAFSNAGFDSVRVLREDKAGRIWAVDGHHVGYWKAGVLNVINAAKFHVLSHEALDLLILPDEVDSVYLLVNGQLLLISTSDNEASWHITDVFGPKLLRVHPELGRLTSVIGDGRSGIWAGCGFSICHVDLRDGKVIEYGKQQGVRPDAWRNLLLTRSGCLWARGEHNIETHADSAGDFRPVSGLPDSTFADVRKRILLEDSQGRIILNLPKGIAMGGPLGWRIFDVRNGLPEDEIDSLLLDRSGELWLTSLGHGILRWRGYGLWEGWNRASGLSSTIVWNLGRSRGGVLWVATDHGVNILDPATHQVLTQELTDQRFLNVVVDDRNHGWAANAQGQVFEIDAKLKRTRLAADKLDRVFQMLVDKQQRIWICSRKGLFFFSQADHWSKPHLIQEAQGPTGYAWSITEDTGGALWVTNATGLYRLSGDLWSRIHLPFPKGIEFNRMLTVAPDGTLWLQNRLPYPVLHLSIRGDTAQVIGQVSGSLIHSDNTTFVNTDTRGWVWVGSDDGVFVCNGSQWVHLTAEDGLLWNDTDFHGFFSDIDGSIWIGTSSGISHLMHPEAVFESLSPKVRLADVSLSGRQISDRTPEFDLRRPVLNFRFQNINYDRGSAVLARYKIDGEDNDWQDTNGGLLRIPALAAGKYRLRMTAYDQRSYEQSSEISVDFTILEPWWKRPWFIALEALGAATIVLVLWRLSIRLLVARQQELERMVTQAYQGIRR